MADTRVEKENISICVFAQKVPHFQIVATLQRTSTEALGFIFCA